MNVSNKTRRLVFEVAALLAIVVIPGTAILLSRMDAELTQKRLDFEELSAVQDERFARRYLEIAKKVEASANAQQTTLTNMLRTRSFASFPLRRMAGEFNEWVQPELSNSKGDQFRELGKKLRDRIAKWTTSAQNDSLMLERDLESLLVDIEAGQSNYMAAAELVLAEADRSNQTTTNLDSALSLEPTLKAAQQLLDLADEARRSGMAIESFLRNQKMKPPPSPILRYLLVAGLLGLFVFLLLAFRCFVTSQLNLELAKKDLVIEHQQQLSHLGQLAAGLAHEIRNPLTAISARLYTLQKGLAEGTPEHQDSAVIRDEVRRLDKIVQDFLTLARPADPKLVPMSTDPFIHKLRDLLAPQYQPLAIELRVDSVVSTRFLADEQQLTQVLMNLIRNAAESMQKQGKITLRARTAQAELKNRVRSVVIFEVEDTGPGIPPEVQDRLFTPFFSTKETGTGLGLPIAARIVNKHGGELTFETRRNHGTTFRIILPASEAIS